MPADAAARDRINHMEGLKKTLQDRLRQKPNKRLHSEIHALADEISSCFGERKKFAMYLGVIKRVGVTRARAIFSDIRSGSADDPRKLFFWRCREAGKAAGPAETPAAKKDG